MQYLDAISKMTEWSLCFQGKLFSNIVIQVCDPTSNAEEAEVEGFYENLQDLLELTPQKNVLSLWNEEKLLNCVWLFVTPRTVDYHAPPSMGFSRQEYWSGLPFPSPEIFPTQGLNPGLPHCRQTLYHLSHQGNPDETYIKAVTEV